MTVLHNTCIMIFAHPGLSVVASLLVSVDVKLY